MTLRLTSSSLAGTSRKLVAVGTPRLASMLVTIRAAAPRRGSPGGSSAARLPSTLVPPDAALAPLSAFLSTLVPSSPPSASLSGGWTTSRLPSAGSEGAPVAPSAFALAPVGPLGLGLGAAEVPSLPPPAGLEAAGDSEPGRAGGLVAGEELLPASLTDDGSSS